MKYVNTEIVFQEIPNEVTLAINISNCKIRCKDCHSKYLWMNIGTKLTTKELSNLINKNKGITCVCFMGGEFPDLYTMSEYIKKNFPDLKIGVYTGYTECPIEIYENFDYIKLGPYREERGGLDNPNTNQALFEVGKPYKGFIPYNDITYKLWKQ